MPKFKSLESQEESRSMVERLKPHLGDYRKVGLLPRGEANIPIENNRLCSIADSSKFIDIDYPKNSSQIEPREMSKYYDDEQQ
jgi:hypothetical protein